MNICLASIQDMVGEILRFNVISSWPYLLTSFLLCRTCCTSFARYIQHCGFRCCKNPIWNPHTISKGKKSNHILRLSLEDTVLTLSVTDGMVFNIHKPRLSDHLDRSRQQALRRDQTQVCSLVFNDESDPLRRALRSFSQIIVPKTRRICF